MRVAERVLAALSRPPGTADYVEASNAWSLENALVPLWRVFPHLPGLVRGARVVDFGCGAGWQAVALARAGAAFVLGVDSNPATLSGARALARRAGVPAERLRFAETIEAGEQGRCDLVISQNSMEHFDRPAEILALMRGALRPDGRILISFGPPWYAPAGSHMHFFTRVPWVNLLFSERTVMTVRARYRADGARRYHEVESGLNRMTIARFERLVASSGTRIARRRYRCVKGIDVLGRLPGVRELFINHVSCELVLDPAAAAPAPAAARG